MPDSSVTDPRAQIVRAHQAVAEAKRKGTLKAPQRCERCNKKSSCVCRLHAHHHDYSQPLAVVWLCPKCHGFMHGKRGLGGKSVVFVCDGAALSRLDAYTKQHGINRSEALRRAVWALLGRES